MDIRKNLARKFELLRRYLGLTQEGFAERVGMERRAVSKTETGKNLPSPETLEKICDILDIPVRYFYDYSTLEKTPSDEECIAEITSELKLMKSKDLRLVRKIILAINEQ